MADLRVITILPPQTIAGVPQVQESASGTHGTSTLATLAPGTILSGFIVNRDASGNPILRTNGGDIAFSSNFFLNIGSEVEIRVENTAAGMLAHILSVNGQPPEIAAAQSAFAQEPDVIVSQNLSASPIQPQITAATATAPAEQPAVTTTLTVTGTVIAPPQPPNDHTTPSLPAGTQVSLKITSLTAAPANSGIPEAIINASLSQPSAVAPQQPPASPAFYTTYAKAAGIPISPAAASPVPAAPSVISVTQDVPQQAAAQLVAAMPAASTSDIPATPPAVPVIAAPPASQPDQPFPSGKVFTATVISNDSVQESHLQTPLGIIRLQPETQLPSGSAVTFEIVDAAVPAQTASSGASLPALPAPLTELAQQWTSLQQIVSILTQGNAPSAYNFTQNILPWVMPPPVPTAQVTVPQNIPMGLLLFMAALRGGNFSNWLGQDNIQWLQAQGHDDVIKKADAEFILIARQFAEAPPSHWQPLFFPIMVAGELHQARLFVKRDRKEKGSHFQEKKHDDTRFIVEIDLTQLGEMQLDGFVRRREKDVQFDLVIRSLTPLPPDVQNDILHIYNNTGELAGYKGSLAFQAVKHFPVNPMEELSGSLGTVMA